MDNYLSHRWPKGPGVQPPPVPVFTGRRPLAPGKKRRWVRPLVVALCVVLLLGLLCGVSFWSVSRLAAYLDGLEFPDYSGDFPIFPSFSVSHSSDWTADDLPWGSPAPSVQLSLATDGGEALSAPDIYERILPSIVYIEVEMEEGGASGTGIVVDRSGYILTNYHIIDESIRIQVMPLAGEGGKSLHDARVVGFDEEFDLAVLKIEVSGLTPAPLGDSDALRVGETVYAVGNPMGYLQGSMSEGIVSSLNRGEEVDDTGMVYIQTTAALNPGNSGGALINDRGQVVGITSAKITGLILDEENPSVEDAAIIENIGLSLPTTDILPFVNHIFATGESCRPAIGIKCAATRQYDREGILVRSVNDGVPAQEAGLTEGDFIIEANGRPVTDLSGLRRVLYRTGVGGEMSVTVLRGGEELEIAFTLIDSLSK